MSYTTLTELSVWGVTGFISFSQEWEELGQEALQEHTWAVYRYKCVVSIACVSVRAVNSPGSVNSAIPTPRGKHLPFLFVLSLLAL